LTKAKALDAYIRAFLLSETMMSSNERRN